MGMSVTDLKNILETVASVMDAGVENYPVDFARKVMAYLESMPEQNINLLAGLLSADPVQLKSDIGKGLKIGKTLDSLFTEGQAQEISQFARNLKDRPLILQFLSWKLN